MAQSFAEALVDLMDASGMSAKTLARRIEVDAAQVGRWRKGVWLPRPDNIIRVARVFDVNYDWLIGLAYPETQAAPLSPPDPIETAIRLGAEEMRVLLVDIPRPFWPTIIRKVFDRAISEVRDSTELARALGASPPVSASKQPRVSAPKRAPQRGPDDTDTELVRRKHPLFRTPALAGA